MSLTETMFLPSSAISICVEEEPPHAPSQPEAMNEQVIRGPLDYLLLMPGKDMRKRLTMAFNEWLGVPEEKISIISDIVNLLHTASLLIDDIQDSSKLRRGSPVAHSIFGTAQTINSANYAYFLAQERLSLLNNPKASQVFVEELLSLHKGQGMDLYWRDTLTCPSEEDYIEMVSNKTGGLFRLAVKLMQLESDKDCDCIPLTNKLGIIFQIRDDVLNLQAKLYAQNKGFCEDITEGKFSFPIIHSIRSDPNNGQLMNILRQKTEDVNLKAYAVDYIKSTNSFTHSNQTVERYLSEARDLVECLNQENGVSRGILHFLEMLKPEDSPAPEIPTGYIKIN